MTASPIARRALVALIFAFAALAAQPVRVVAQVVNGEGDKANVRASRAAPPVLDAVPLAGEAPVIDGALDDAAWQTASVARDFVQRNPYEGRAASQPTEVRILYSEDALYVGMRAWDSDPDSIVGILTRRGENSPSDWLHVLVDSYNDRRTAFRFSVNPVGVKQDVYHYDDTQEDSGWTAVWEVATQVDEHGWTAEFRIPYSQLRFSSASVQTWGINFARDIARHNETSAWAPLSQEEQALVSRSGLLRGLENLSRPRRVELQPYTLGRMSRLQGDSRNPFHSPTELNAEIGADLKFGVTSNLTLDLTVNPDFGQVEADPGQVNLTAFETFLPERRPFFVEGANIFRAGLGIGDGDGANQSLFYTRRIGRAPQGQVSAQGGYVDAPRQTRILAAGKLSGKTANGWSMGILDAVTSEESAEIVTGAGDRLSRPVEPLTNYGVVRLQKDFRQGRSAAGFIGTAMHRDGETADALLLRRSAYSGGFDARHRFGGDNYQISASLLGSRVSGSSDAILLTQLSPIRYYQRPDAEHVELDATRTSLVGWSSTVELWKVGGGPWRFAVGNQMRSPGFEPNDVGFMTEGDFRMLFGFVGYRQSRPGRHLMSWNANTNGWTGWNFGGDRISLGGNVNGSLQLLNFWSAFAGINRQAENLNTGLLRGGPAMIVEPNLNGWFGVSSDSRKDLQVSWNNNWNVRSESDSWSYNTSPNLRWRPSGQATLRVGPFLARNSNDRQWVGRLEADGEPHYVFGRLEQRTVGLTVRADYTVTPNLSLQLYAQPFMSAGEYGDFKRVSDPRAARYEDRFDGLDAQADDGVYRADLNGDGALEQWGDPDFNIKQFRSNAVVRWEYRPGSTLFLVWAQARDHFERDGGFHLGDASSSLFGRKPDNVFMVKLNYWLN